MYMVNKSMYINNKSNEYIYMTNKPNKHMYISISNMFTGIGLYVHNLMIDIYRAYGSRGGSSS